MKNRNNFKHTSSVILLVCLLLGVGSCIKEEVIGETKTNSPSSVAIKVKMPEITSKAPMSRANVADFDEMRNMNILISDNGIIKKRIYLDFITNKWGDGTDFIFGTANSEGVTVTVTQEGNYNVYHLDFSDAYLTDIPLKTCQFHAVANWDSPITTNEDKDLVTTLHKLKATTQSTTISGKTHAVPSGNVMYGEIIDEDSEVIDSANPAEVKRIVTIGLKRLAAMITLKINGSKLEKGVVISLTDVTLRNVPKTCTLGSGNEATEFTTDISAYGDRQEGPTLAGGSLVGDETQAVDGFKAEDGYLTSIGGHYPINADEDKTVTDFSDETVQPLFLFENMKGIGRATTDETMKMPNDVVLTDGTDPKQAIADYNKEGTYSYIEVNADYIRYSGASFETTEERGTATWRFFLGEDETTDFNIKRNKNYQLTLTLSGSGINEEEASWRVDTELTKPDVVGNSNMVVGGGGEMFCVEFNGNIANLMNNVKLTADQPNTVYVCVKSGNGEAWIPVPQKLGGASGYKTVDDKQMWFYVQPLMPGDTDYFEGDKRVCTVTFKTQNNTPVTSVTFTQYRPLTVTITPAEVNNTTAGCDCMQRVKHLIENYYNHVFANDDDNFTFYVDRVDRDPMQWGFYGVYLDHNMDTGFENVYHLIDPLPEYNGTSCQGHIDYAKNYLPTGKGWKEVDGDNIHIDYTRGSCMMHAAMENYWQSFYPYPGYNGAEVPLLADMVKTTTLPTRPQDDDGVDPTRRLSWSVPSIVGWQMLEILDKHHQEHGGKAIFDPTYPITQWTSYWTSNYGSLELKDKYPSLNITGLHRSFAYQFGLNLDRIGTNDLYPGRLLLPRTSMVRYRLINVRPEKLKTGTGTETTR